jgi:hypothetical protein
LLFQAAWIVLSWSGDIKRLLFEKQTLYPGWINVSWLRNPLRSIVR